jgi:hypothetical protein
MNSYKDQWERIYVPVIRGNLNNEIRKQYFGEFDIHTIEITMTLI